MIKSRTQSVRSVVVVVLVVVVAYPSPLVLIARLAALVAPAGPRE